jgi:hypothetical protein
MSIDSRESTNLAQSSRKRQENASKKIAEAIVTPRLPPEFRKD